MPPLAPYVRDQAAVLDAAGHSVKRIAGVLAIGEGTVKKWRKEEDYRRLVDHYSDRLGREIEPIVQRVRADVLDAATEAIAKARELLEATDKEGRPHHYLQLQAAQTILSRLHLVTDPERKDDTPNTAVIVVDPELLKAAKSAARPGDVEGTGSEIE